MKAKRTEDFDLWPLDEQRASYQHDYEMRDVGHGTNTRFADDLGRMFVTEDCGGDLNFVIYDLDGKQSAFTSLDPHEVIRLANVINERVASYQRP